MFSAVDWCVPADIAVRPYRVDRIVPGVGGDYVVTMGDGRSNFDDSDNPPMPVVVYMGGVTLSAGSSGTGFNPTGNFSNGTAAANTDSADPVGLSKQEQAKLASFINNIGSSDGGSRNGPQDPTATHLALASPGAIRRISRSPCWLGVRDRAVGEAGTVRMTEVGEAAGAAATKTSAIGCSVSSVRVPRRWLASSLFGATKSRPR